MCSYETRKSIFSSQTVAFVLAFSWALECREEMVRLAFPAEAWSGVRASLWSPTMSCCCVSPQRGGTPFQEPLAAGWVCNSYPNSYLNSGFRAAELCPCRAVCALQPLQALARVCTHSQEEDSGLLRLFACFKRSLPHYSEQPLVWDSWY